MSFFNRNPADKFLLFLKNNCCWVKKNLRMCEIYLKHPLYRNHTLGFSWLESATLDIVNQYNRKKAALASSDSFTVDRETLLDEFKDKLLKHIIFALHEHVSTNSEKEAFTQKTNKRERNKCSLAKTLLELLIGDEGNRINRTTLENDMLERCKNNLEDYIQAKKAPTKTEQSSYIHLHKM